MKTHSLIALVVLSLSTVSTRAIAQGAAPKFGPAPAVFPAGAKMAVMQGDPGKTELFTVRLDFPAGYTIPAHFHPTDEHITVIHGALQVGMGDKFDAKHMMTVGTGGFATAPAKMNHYTRAKGHTIVQIHAMGPFAMTYVNPSDDPSRKAGGK